MLLARRGHTVTSFIPLTRIAGARAGRRSRSSVRGRDHSLRSIGPAAFGGSRLRYQSGRPAYYASAPCIDIRKAPLRRHPLPQRLAGRRAGRAALGQAVSSSTRRTSTGSSARRTCSSRDNREPCIDAQCSRCTLRYRRPPQLWRYTGLLERSVPHVDLFLSPSSFTIEAHRARGFTGAMRRLPLFVPESEIGRGKELVGDRPYFLFVGRLEHLKGVQVLVELFRSYRDADLLIAGSGTYDASLRRQAEGLDHVHFLDGVYGGRLDALYRGATALLVPSVGYETFGIVIVEAMARGTPSIVHDLGALPEVIEDSGGAGIVYRTTDELLDAMRRLRADPGLRSKLGERGRRAWQERWSEEPHLEGYFAAIEEARGAA